MKITWNIEINRRPRKDNTHQIFIRFTQNRRHKRLIIPYSIPLKSFNKGGKTPPSYDKKNWILRSNPRANLINESIASKINKAEGIMQDAKSNLSLDQLVNQINNYNPRSFLQYFESLLQTKYKGRGYGTYRLLTTELKKVKEFLGRNDLLFEEFNYQFLRNYENYLRIDRNNNVNTVHKSLSKLRTIIGEAVRERIFSSDKNPFLSYKFSKGITRKVRLTIDEIHRIEALDLPKQNLIFHARNIFLFSFYNSGIRIGDCLEMTWDNIKNRRLVYVMTKNNKLYDVTLTAQALDILIHYSGLGDEFIFPFLPEYYWTLSEEKQKKLIMSKTQLINRSLKQIALKAEIDKNISCHVARHSFADYARTKTSDLYSLSKLLQHSDLKTTQLYLKGFDQDSQDTALDQIFRR